MPLTAASGNLRSVRPTLLGKLKWLEWRVSHWRAGNRLTKNFPSKPLVLGTIF
jgi:hypothetical protein